MRTLMVVLVAGMLSGCASSGMRPSGMPHPVVASNPDSIQVFNNVVPDRPFTVVGDVWARWNQTAFDPYRLVPRLKQEAAKLGADAIVILNAGVTDPVAYTAYGVTSVTGSTGISARAIVWRDTTTTR